MSKVVSVQVEEIEPRINSLKSIRVGTLREEQLHAMNRELSDLKARGRRIRMLTGRVPPAIAARIEELHDCISRMSDPVIYGDGRTP